MAGCQRRLTNEEIAEAQYLFKAIDMAKSDEEIDFDLCATCSSPTADDHLVEYSAQHHESKMFAWNYVKHRRRPHRRYTVSHGGGSSSSSLPPAPPAPPSTPTSLTANNTPMSSPTASTQIGGGHGAGGGGNGLAGLAAEDDTINSLLYLLDYAPKYKKKLKDQQRTDSELAELFNVVTITSNGVGGGGGIGGSGALSAGYNKLPPERGISSASRVIRKHDATTKIFKIHRNPKEFFRDLDEENSVSAPEYDTEEEDTRYRRFTRLKPSRRFCQTKRQRRFARFEHKERMEDMVDTFDASMSFNDA